MRVASRDARLGEVRILGLAGSAAVSAAAASVGALPFDDGRAVFLGTVSLPVYDRLTSSPPGMMVLAYFGLALLIGAWLRLGRIVRERTVEVRELVVTLVWWAAPLAVAAPLYSRDVYSYVGQGALFVEGIDPYDFGPAALDGVLGDHISQVWQHTPAPYGPTFLLMAGAVMLVAGEQLVVGIVGMRLLALAALAVFVWAVPVIARRCGVDPGRAMWLGVLNPLVLAHVVSGAHNDAVMTALLLVAAVLLLRDRPLAAAAVIGAATLVKAPAVLGLAFVVAAVWGPQRLRAVPLAALSARVAAAGLGTVAVLTLVTGAGFGWIPAMSNTAEIHNGLSMTTNVGGILDVVLRLLGLASPVDLQSVTRALGLLAAVGITAYLLLRHRERPLWGLAVALVAFVALGPVVNPWYLLWGLVLLAATTEAPRTVRWATLASATLALYPMPAGGAPTLDAVIGLAGLAAAAVVLWWVPLAPVREAAPARETAEPASESVAVRTG